MAKFERTQGIDVVNNGEYVGTYFGNDICLGVSPKDVPPPVLKLNELGEKFSYSQLDNCLHVVHTH